METWVLYALLSALFGGLFNFGLKIVAERNYDINYVAFLSYVVMALLAGISFLYRNSLETALNGIGIMILIGVLARTCFFLSTITRVQGLKYIDTTLFFPLYKTLFPLLAVLVGIFFFSEPLGLKESLGVVIGISVPLLLITKKENSVQKNIKYGIVFILLTSILILVSAISFKYIISNGFNLDFYILLSASLGIILSFTTFKTTNKYNKKTFNTKNVTIFSSLLGMSQFGSIFFFSHALYGNMAIVVTIDSFGILIPIILSVIFYKEEMTWKKALVILLSIVSVILFI